MKYKFLFILPVLFCTVSFNARADEPSEGSQPFGVRRVQPANSHVVPVAEVGLPFYKNIRQFYNYRDYKPGFNDRYDALGATIASALVPGLGQTLCGEPYRGIYFIAGTGLLWGASAACITAAEEYSYYDDQGRYRNDSGYLPAAAVTFLGGLAVWVWNVIDANHVAKTKNLYLRDIMDKTGVGELRLSPSFGYIPSTGPSAGLTLAVSF